MSRRYRNYSVLETIYMVVCIGGIVLVVIAGIIGLIVRPINKVSNIRTVEGTVTEKTTKRAKNTDKFLVFITDASGNVSTLEVTDSLLRPRFDSADVYAGIEPNKTYSFEVGGSRVPVLSWYPNIYSYEEIGD